MVRSDWGHRVVTLPAVASLGGSSPAAVPDKIVPCQWSDWILAPHVELGIKGAEGVDF